MFLRELGPYRVSERLVLKKEELKGVSTSVSNWMSMSALHNISNSMSMAHAQTEDTGIEPNFAKSLLHIS